MLLYVRGVLTDCPRPLIRYASLLTILPWFSLLAFLLWPCVGRHRAAVLLRVSVKQNWVGNVKGMQVVQTEERNTVL